MGYSFYLFFGNQNSVYILHCCRLSKKLKKIIQKQIFQICQFSFVFVFIYIYIIYMGYINTLKLCNIFSFLSFVFLKMIKKRMKK